MYLTSGRESGTIGGGRAVCDESRMHGLAGGGGKQGTPPGLARGRTPAEDVSCTRLAPTQHTYPLLTNTRPPRLDRRVAAARQQPSVRVIGGGVNETRAHVQWAVGKEVGARGDVVIGRVGVVVLGP